MAINLSFTQSGCCLLVPDRWRCQLAIMIRSAAASSSPRVNQVWVGRISILSMSYLFFFNFADSKQYHAKQWKSKNKGMFPRYTHAINDVRFKNWHPWCIFWNGALSLNANIQISNNYSNPKESIHSWESWWSLDAAITHKKIETNSSFYVKWCTTENF